MSDYRDPNYRDPRGPGYPDPNRPTEAQPWSNATWGWIAGIVIAALVLIFAFSAGNERVATDNASPPATTGQRNVPPPGGDGPKTGAPTTNQQAPAPQQAPSPNQGGAR
jgi:hypothetical protein